MQHADHLDAVGSGAAATIASAGHAVLAATMVGLGVLGLCGRKR